MLYMFFMEITKFYSPNFSEKTLVVKNITLIIIHYTGMQSERESLKRLTILNQKLAVTLLNK